jgi:nitrite reductase/ring-hydroxylating ferredoxin subunit
MSNGRNWGRGKRDEALPSVEQIARLDAFLDQLTADRRPPLRRLAHQELAERLLAAQLRLILEGVEEPTPQFLRALERVLAHAAAHERRRRRPLNRRGLLRTASRAAAVAGLIGAGVAADSLRRRQDAPQSLVPAAGRWYDIAGAGELADGQIKGFAAGSILGFLVNEGGRLRAVSAICTHMGCRLKPDQGSLELHCLCHGARFGVDGRVLAGPAVARLPSIDIRVRGGRVYARGTSENV